MNAKTLAEFLKTSDNPEITMLGVAIEEARELLIQNAKSPESPISSDYWKKHKFVADISTDMDFYLKDNDNDEISSDLVLEWIADTHEEAIAQAKDYLSNVENYIGNKKNIEYFIKDYVEVGFAHILDNNVDFWGTGGNWEIELQCERPDAMPPEASDYCPHVDVFGQRIELLTQAELIELGFVVNKD